MKKASSILSGLAALSLVFSGMPVTAVQAAEDFQASLEARYASPAMENKTEVRWWLPEGGLTDEIIEQEIQTLYDQGFIGFELCMLDEAGVDPDVYGYGSESWQHSASVAIKKAASLGMRVGITSGTHWRCANIPGLDPNSEAAGQEVAISQEMLEPGQSRSGALLPANVRRGYEQEDVLKSLVGVYAYRVASQGEGGRTVLAAGSAVDLTDQVVADGQSWSLDFTAPEDGTYVLYSMWQQGCFQEQEPSQEDAFAINYYNDEGVQALEDYLASYYFSDPELVEAVKGADIQFFMDSLEIENSDGTRALYWSDDMAQEFLSRKGYDIVPYLPLMQTYYAGVAFTGVVTDVNAMGLGGTVLSMADSDEPDELTSFQILNDWFDVQTDLIREKMMEPLRAWAKENYDMTLRAQMAYGTYMEISEMGLSSDYIETETLNMKDQTDTYRLWSGAAHIMDTMYSSETGAIGGMNYALTDSDYLYIAYNEMAAGVNRVIWHGHSSSWGPEDNTNWPGYEGMGFGISTRLDSREPVAVDYPAFNDHFGRVQGLLREGSSRTDLGILHLNYGENTEYPFPQADYLDWHQGIYWTDTTLQDEGYTYDYFSPAYLEEMELDPETLTLGDSVGYQAVLVQQRVLPVYGASRLLELAKQGLRVVLLSDAGTISPYYSDDEAELAALMEELKGLENVAVVETEAEAYEALTGFGILPRAALTAHEGQDQLLTQMREDAEGNRYLFVYNYCSGLSCGEDHELTANQEISLEGVYVPYEIDAWSGKVTKSALYRVEDGRTVLNVSLANRDVALFALEKAEEVPLHVVSTEADVVYEENGVLYAVSQSSRDLATVLSDGTEVSLRFAVAEAPALNGWELTVEDWTEGEKEYSSQTRTTPVYDAETKEFSEAELTTTDVLIGTKKNEISVTLDELASWDAIPELGRAVCGVGTYKCSFTWEGTENDGLLLSLANVYQSAAVFVNGQEVGNVNLKDSVIDITGALQAGENTLEIRYTTTLTNRLLEMGILQETEDVHFNSYQVAYRANGLTGASLVPYAVTAVE